ncbi:MAG TPA: bifunctional phosphopantothenoylcysteine decarboxylase/phosphopantothenate--cysteine ligase CoaBC [Dehalococcoidia bacterium]|nr:bifunctional phosphopantothenoylcysteine decarboxylase/phosphopantothenate--cysteine ligase CoaBC [Dehalococcoidia bacterium]
MLDAKNIVLGVTGSIAAYKAVDLASRLTGLGARVDVIMTQAATKFVTPLSFRNVTHRPVVTEMFELASEFSLEHVALAEAASAVVIAPATANIMAKLAAGIADDMLTCTVLATKAPVIIAPAMNVNMWENPVTQENVSRLRSRGFRLVGPEYGRLASGIMGMGRLAELDDIIAAVEEALNIRADLSGRRIVVTAGGTQEPIDPVRFISNHSSGKMGYALAQAARDRGARVVLITAPTALPDPPGLEVVHVTTAAEMLEAVLQATSQADALIMAAAVSDYRPAGFKTSKLKRDAGALTLELVRNPDILAQAQGDFLRVGFAAESEDLLENAKRKLEKKNLDLIVANQIGGPESTFGSDTNRVTIIDRQGRVENLPTLLKTECAQRILDRVVDLLAEEGR